MNFPMIDEINGNTNSTAEQLKEAILNGTIDEEQLSAAVTEILGAMPAEGLTSVVKSVQAGTIELAMSKYTGTATINAVDLEKAVCFFGGVESGSGGAAYFSNATTVRGRANTAGTDVYYTVVEFY